MILDLVSELRNNMDSYAMAFFGIEDKNEDLCAIKSFKDLIEPVYLKITKASNYDQAYTNLRKYFINDLGVNEEYISEFESNHINSISKNNVRVLFFVGISKYFQNNHAVERYDNSKFDLRKNFCELNN
jgi:hypothetical protein